jgi:hypothetical protein
MPNRAFLRAANCLTHPITIGAIALLLLNDHVLRIRWPSWWTGKLGDLTWVFFAPFICALFVSWIVLRNHKHQEKLVGIISILFIGVWFALAKTIPTVHDLTMNTVEAINGWKGSIRLDVTDLIVLPILILSWILWQKSPNTNFKPSHYLLPIFVLGIFSTLASDFPERDAGIFCIQNNAQQLIILTGEAGSIIYTSYNGGLTWINPKTDWSYESSDKIKNCPWYPQLDTSWQISDPQNTNIIYRFNRGQSIERSTDKGQTWTLDYDLSYLSKDVRNIYHYGEHSQTTGEIYVYLGPLDAKFDPTTSNLVLAMGWDGILVRTPDSKWQWVTVGPYHLDNLNQPQNIIPFLSANELWLAFFLIPLGLTTIIYTFGKVTCSAIGIVIAWFLWAVCLWIPPDYRTYPLGQNFSLVAYIAYPLIALIALPLAYGAIKKLRGKIALRNLLSWSAISALLFLLPFALWTQGTIGNYPTAVIFAVALAVTTLISAWFMVKNAPDFEIVRINDE